MKVISLVNHKGGVGKTTITMNFGAELAERGKKVLLIDLDSQGNLTKATGIKIRKELGNVYTVAGGLMKIMKGEDFKAEDYIYQSKINKNLDVIACCIDMADTKIALNIAMARETMLKLFIDKIKEVKEYDYILIDNAPSIEVDFQNSLVASDEVLIITEADEFSTDGMESLLKQLAKIKSFFNPKLKVSGILINKADFRTNLCKDMVIAIRELFGKLRVFNTIIPASVKLKESQIMKVSIKTYDKENPVAKAISYFTDEYLGGN